MPVNGAILYEGPSVLTGDPIVCIMTGLARKSQNPKTGPMLQTWILRADQNPITSAKRGDDAAICGGCKLRGKGDGTLKDRACYVNLAQGPLGVWNAYIAGEYLDRRRPDQRRLCGEQVPVRIGSYGDPAAVPFEVWRNVLDECEGWTGYTHQWRHARFDARLAGILMLSCESEVDRFQALERFPEARTFRAGKDVQAGYDEVFCPADGKSRTCNMCQLCRGTSVRGRSVVIEAHGSGRNATAWRQA